MKQKKIISIYMVVLCVIYGLIVVCTPLYNINVDDNYAISLVLNGSYGADNYCIFVNPVLAWTIRILKQIYSGADYFALFQIIFVFLGVVWLLRCLDTILSSKKKFVTIGLIIVGTASLLDLAHQNFTIAAAFFTITGLSMLVWSAKGEVGKSGCVIGTLFACLGMIWRKNAFMLCMPFFALVIAAEFIYYFFKKNSDIKRMILTFLPAVVLISGLYTIHSYVNIWGGVLGVCAVQFSAFKGDGLSFS